MRLPEMSKVETQVDDPKKLALRCKTLEMQLRQSVSKKEHHEITSKLEKQVDSLERDLDRARAENQKTIAINKQIGGVEGLISSLIKTANAQGKTLDFIEEEASTRGKALTAQGKVLDALATKLSQGTVPSNVHLQALSKIRDLEEDKRGMVRRFDYNSLEGRCAELSRQLATMVPSSDYTSLKERFDEATRQLENMVPASDYSALKLRVEELEGAVS
jgi:tetrahydromethanopterin S-methyltransferase subunit G